MCKAAVAWAPGKPLTVVVEEVTVAPPKQGEVRVKVSSVSIHLQI